MTSKYQNEFKILADEFDSLFQDCKMDDRAFRFLIGYSGRMIDVDEISRDALKADLLKYLEFPPNNAAVGHFRRYSNKIKRVDESCFDFVSESKFEEFLLDSAMLFVLNNSYSSPLTGDVAVTTSDHGRARMSEIFGRLRFSTKNRLMFFFDLWDVDMQRKLMELESMKNHVLKFRFDYKKFEWFDLDERRLEAAHSFISKEHPEFKEFRDSDDLRLFFYKNFQFNPDKVELIFRKIRELYNNRKSRASKSTKQKNFQLSIKAVKNIERLSEKYDENVSRIVDLVFYSDEFYRKIDVFLNQNGVSRTGIRDN